MQDEELEEEEANDQYDWRNKNIWRNQNIIDAVDDTRTDDTSPKSLNTLYASIVFPSKCFLTERKVPRIVDKS